MVDTLLKFLTALAWTVGVISIPCLVANIRDEDGPNTRIWFWIFIVCLAWLVARYF